MTYKIQKAAVEAKKLGYTHIASVVKTHYTTTYHNVNDIDTVIHRGWDAAPRLGNFNCSQGVTTHEMNQICKKVISRKECYALLYN